MAHAGAKYPGWGFRTRRFSGAGGIVLAVLILLAGSRAVWGQAAPQSASSGERNSIIVSRNLFFDRTDRPARTLTTSAGLSLGPELLDVGTPDRLQLTSPTALVSAALNFRAVAEDGWVLTVFITAGRHERDFYYLGKGQRAVNGALEPQTDYHAKGLETELTARDSSGTERRVREIVLQDDGESELRVALDGNTLRITAVPPKFGGKPNPGRFPGGQGPPLRFLDYQLLGGGYTDNGFGELWLWDLLVLRANYFTNNTETRSVGRLEFAQQAWRSERFSVWLEGGAAVSQTRNEKTNTTGNAHVGLTMGLTGNWRYNNFGAALHLGSAAGPLVAQLLGGWQFSERWGALISWQHVKDSSGFGLGMSVDW